MDSKKPYRKHLHPPPRPYRGRLKSPLAELTPGEFIRFIHSATAGAKEPLSQKGGVAVNVARIHQEGKALYLAIKREEPQNVFRAYWMALTTTRAKRAFIASERLFRGQGLCPQPYGYVERINGGKLAESVFICHFLDGMDNFRDALIRFYKQQSDISVLLPLLRTVARAMQRFHDAGFVHNDMGNQNILLQQTENGVWKSARFVDLDHTRVCRRISLRRRAYDLSRINLPDGLLSIFKQFYFSGSVPKRFERWEKWYRRRFEWHRRTRLLRHPLRTVKRRRKADSTIQIPHYRNIWFFDPRSLQAVDIFGERAPKPPRTLRYTLRQGPPALAMLPSVVRSYKKVRAVCFQKEIDLKGRFGLSLDFTRGNADGQLSKLNQLPPVPVHVSLYSHQGAAEHQFKLALIRNIRPRQSVVATLVQNRRAAIEPFRWGSFCKAVLPTLASVVDGIQIGKAINRGHWGVWSAEEYHRLLSIANQSVDPPGTLPLMGPGVENGCIADLVAGLSALPAHVAFSSLSQTISLYAGSISAGMHPLNQLLSRMTWFKAVAGAVRSCQGRTAVTQFRMDTPWTGYYRQINTDGGGFNPRSAEDLMSAAGKLVGSVTELLCSGMVDQVFLHLPMHLSAQKDYTSGGAVQLTPEIVAALNQWLTLCGNARFISHRTTAKGIRCLTMAHHPGEEMTMVHSPGGRQPFEIDFEYDKITNFQGDTLHSVSGRIDIALTPVYFQHATPRIKAKVP
jgi:hypothetical protein